MPELPGNVAAHREAAEDDFVPHVELIQQPGEIVGVAAHGDRPVAERALAEAAEVRSEHAIALRKLVDLRLPHRVVERKAVDEEQHGPAAAVFDGEFDVRNGNGAHGVRRGTAWIASEAFPGPPKRSKQCHPAITDYRRYFCVFTASSDLR